MELTEILVTDGILIKDALKKLNITSGGVLLIIDEENTFLGTLSDGDIRRYLLKGRSINDDISEVYNKKPLHISEEDFTNEKAKAIILKNRIDLLPIVNKEGKVVDSITWDNLLSGEEKHIYTPKIHDVPVVIMAGGQGTRLDPFTRVLPKPLIPIGDKPIIEIIVEKFLNSGVDDFYISINHKSAIIEAYFAGFEKGYSLSFLKEKNYLGTAGSLKMLQNEKWDNYIVSNCDVIVDADYHDVLKYHRDEKAALTILAPIKHYKIPYGVLEFGDKGKMLNLIEKPEYTFTINSGVYILNKESIKYVPEGKKFDMTDLIRILSDKQCKVAVYPLNGNIYYDIGQWEEYKNATAKFRDLAS